MRHVDVAVVGAGPAGICAALAAAATGAETLLLDENRSIGGQLQWRLTPTLHDELPFDITPAIGPAVASQLQERLESLPNLSVELDTVVWGLFEDNLIGLSTAENASEVTARSIILATGSTDIVTPFPGWTLPGVLTARAVQIFMHVHRVLPGMRWAILGRTDEAIELRSDLESAGQTVVCIVDEADGFRASGTNRLAHVESGVDVFEVDGLAIALGRQPDPELALQAQADNVFDDELGGFVPTSDINGMTSVDGLFVAGDAAGVGSIAEVMAEGYLAGFAAAGAAESVISDARQMLAQFATHARASARMKLGSGALAASGQQEN